MITTPMFRTVCADPPWRFSDQLQMSDVKRGAGDHYPTMTVDEICRLGDAKSRCIAGHLTPRDAFLWLWVTNSFLLDGSGHAVCRAWGYEPKQLITWVKGKPVDGQVKIQIGMGHMTRNATEHMILATRGSVTSYLLNRNVPNVFIAPRRRHSQKPDEAFALIERVSPGPNLELFARRARNNFTVWGSEVAA